MDFLFAVDELSQLGHSPDDVEVALTLNEMDKEKVSSFSDFGSLQSTVVLYVRRRSVSPVSKLII